MMIKNSIKSVERELGVSFGFREDIPIRKALKERGFNDLEQLIAAYRGMATGHASRRRVLFVYQPYEAAEAELFRQLIDNRSVEVITTEIDVGLPHEGLAPDRLREHLRVVVRGVQSVAFLIGRQHIWQEWTDMSWHYWMDWITYSAIDLDKGLLGVRTKDRRGSVPPYLEVIDAAISRFERSEVLTAIERAAAQHVYRDGIHWSNDRVERWTPACPFRSATSTTRRT